MTERILAIIAVIALAGCGVVGDIHPSETLPPNKGKPPGTP